jgi:hypothetical protein
MSDDIGNEVSFVSPDLTPRRQKMSNDTEYRNPIRHSIRRKTIVLSDFPHDVEKVEMRPSTGDILIHWRDAEDSDPGSQSQ